MLVCGFWFTLKIFYVKKHIKKVSIPIFLKKTCNVKRVKWLAIRLRLRQTCYMVWQLIRNTGFDSQRGKKLALIY
jgi:hypothetical protein